MTYDNNDGPIYSVLNGKFGPNGCPQSDDFETYGYCERFYIYSGIGNMPDCIEQATYYGIEDPYEWCDRCVHPATGADC